MDPIIPPVPAPSEFETADDMLEHIKAKCEEFSAWAHEALGKATEHVHAQPLGELVGKLAHTVHQIEGMQGTGVLFALEQPLLKLLEDFETRTLEAIGSRLDAKIGALHSAIDTKLGQHSERIQAMLIDTIRSPPLEPEAGHAPAPLDSVEEPPPDASMQDAITTRRPYEAPAIIREEPYDPNAWVGTPPEAVAHALDELGPPPTSSPDVSFSEDDVRLSLSSATVEGAPAPFVPVEPTPAPLAASSSADSAAAEPPKDAPADD